MQVSDFFAPVDKVLNGFEKVGIVLRPASDGTSLYIWQCDGCAIYVGKKTTARTRGAQEQAWVKANLELNRYEIPFTRIMRRTNAKYVEYVIETIDMEMLRSKIVEHGVEGFSEGFAQLASKDTLTNADIELSIIRAIVQSGYILANSTGAGLWDGELRLGHLIGSLVAWESQKTGYDLFDGLYELEETATESSGPNSDLADPNLFSNG